MSVPRAKKNKRPEHHRAAKSPFEIIKLANRLDLALDIRILYTVYGWRTKRIDGWTEAKVSLLREIADGRITVDQMIKDTMQLTGHDVDKILEDVLVERKK